MRLIDAEKIGEFASHHTEFDGKPLTKREKDLVDNVCRKISTQMPAAYDVDRVMEQLGKMREQHYDKILRIVKAGGINGQTDSF